MTTEYTLHMTCEDGGSETTTIRADTLDEARETAGQETRDWIRDGEWGDEGADVSGGWTLEDEDGEEIEEGSVRVEIEPDHAALIRAATGRDSRSCGDDPDDHDWTSEGEGGCRENPGVWSHGGTAMSFASHCKTCGLHRLHCSTGSQRNPGEHDATEYTMPDSWCAECEAEECTCEPTGPWIVVRQDTLQGWHADAGEWESKGQATEYDDHDEALEVAAELEDEIGRKVGTQLAVQYRA